MNHFKCKVLVIIDTNRKEINEEKTIGYLLSIHSATVNRGEVLFKQNLYAVGLSGKKVIIY